MKFSDHAILLNKGCSNQGTLEVVEDNVEGEIVMTTLNGLLRSWDSFIQGMCFRRKLITFNRLWEECTQEKISAHNKRREYGRN